MSTPTAGAGAPVRLLSIPAEHPYVEAVRPDGVQPVAPGRVQGFAPDPAWEPSVMASLATGADVVHVHFGFDHLTPDQLRSWRGVLGDAGVGLVVTAHDLRNPHHRDRRLHDELLAVLLPAADGLVTLTPGAAAEIGERLGLAAAVLPHPTVADPARSADVTPEPGLVSLHLKSLRTNLVDPAALVAASLDGARRGGGRLRVDLHAEVADDPRVAGLVDARETGLEVSCQPRFDDRALERYLRRAQVTVLPHRWGTHSGWLELARDLGTRVVAPSCGYYADQWPEVVTYRNDESAGLDPASLADAVEHALRLPAVLPADRPSRLAERARVREAHGQLYRDLIARVRPGAAG